MLVQGNQHLLVHNMDTVVKMMNSDECNTHVVTVHALFCRLSPYVGQVPQGKAIKDGKVDCLGWFNIKISRAKWLLSFAVSWTSC
jgi:hypothetical protein